jgi:hypothetical protein
LFRKKDAGSKPSGQSMLQFADKLLQSTQLPPRHTLSGAQSGSPLQPSSHWQTVQPLIARLEAVSPAGQS